MELTCEHLIISIEHNQGKQNKQRLTGLKETLKKVKLSHCQHSSNPTLLSSLLTNRIGIDKEVFSGNCHALGESP